jgi:hypothetical protein
MKVAIEKANVTTNIPVTLDSNGNEFHNCQNSIL